MKTYLTLFLLLLGVVSLDAKKTCTCGDHATGITTFFVDDGQKCCKGLYSGGNAAAGEFRTYALDNDNVWVQIELSFIDNNVAQSNCCN